jgi:hypothetical protein
VHITNWTGVGVMAAGIAIFIGVFAWQLRQDRKAGLVPPRPRHREIPETATGKTPAAFYQGPMPTYEDTPLLPSEKDAFEWITEALKAEAKARNDEQRR